MNSSFNITDPDDTDGNTAPYFPAYGHALLGCMLAFVFVFGSISNGLGILTFMKNKHLRSPTNTFILSLLISDFGMCFIGTPLTMMASFATKWIWGDVGCSMEGFLVFLFGMTNMYSLVAISVDRFVVIALPLHSSKITDRVAFMCCLGCWSIGLFWSTAPFFGWSYYHLGGCAHILCRGMGERRPGHHKLHHGPLRIWLLLSRQLDAILLLQRLFDGKRYYFVSSYNIFRVLHTVCPVR